MEEKDFLKLKKEAEDWGEKDSIFNWEQNKAIELEKSNPELSAFLLEQGRQKQAEKHLKDIFEGEKKQNEKKEVNQWKLIIEDEKGKKKVSIDAVADYLIHLFNFKTILGSRDDKIYLYDEGIYKNIGKSKIITQTEEMLGSYCRTNVVNEILEKIKRRTAIDKEEFNKMPENLICVENGILNITTREFSGYDPNYYFTKKIPIIFNVDSKPEKIMGFLKEVIYPEDLSTIQEWFGFCLYKRYFIKKSMILFGEKNTGKTVFLNILSSFIGSSNISGLSLQRISVSDKFGLASLKDKMINSYDDLSTKDLSDSGGFKIATGGGYITAEYKFGDSFQFMTYAKNIFATNKIPNVKDINDDAYYERWIPIPFDNQIETDKQKNFLINELTTADQLSGLLNWALEGLDRLLQNGKFSYNKTSEEIKMLMLRQNNPLISFVDEVLYRDDGNRIDKETMYKIYSNWCQVKRVPRMSKEQIGRSLAKYTNYIIAKGGNERVWENVNIHNEHSIL